jgi:hypothetical protein
MEEEAAGSTESQWDIGALIHAVSGVSAIVLGGLMYSKAWAQGLFSLLMGIAAVSAIYFSWKHDAWVRGHWLAMVPVMGVILGYVGWPPGFTLAYVALWLAFIHFVIRGIQSWRSSNAPSG